MTDEQKIRLRQKLKPVIIFGALGLVYYIWLLLTDLRIPCIFYEVTGVKCPGCGITRMIMAVLRFDFASAFSYNGAVLLVLLWLGIIYALETVKYVKSGSTESTVFSKIVFSLCCAVILIYGIVRNF